VQVSFAEAEGARGGVRAIPIKTRADIERELSALRAGALGAAASAPAPPPARGVAAAAPAGDIDRRLLDIVGGEGLPRQEYRRKGSARVPAELLRKASALHVNVVVEGVDGEEQTLADVVLVRLVDSRRADRLSIHLDLELKPTPEPR
jgi:hypothetical protein